MLEIRIIVVLLLVLGLTFSVSSQSFKQAKKSFNKGDYKEAVENFVLLLKDSSISEDQLKNATLMIAESYQLQNLPEEALEWYRNLLKIDSSLVDKVHFAKLLIQNGLYSECKNYIIQTKEKNNPEIRDLLKIVEHGLALTKEDSVYKVENMWNLNSPGSDFGTSLVLGEISLSSNRNSEADEEAGFGLLDLYIQPHKNVLVKMKGEINSEFNEGTLIYSEFHQMGFFTQCNGYDAQRIHCNIYTTIYDKKSNTWSMGQLFKPIKSSANSGHPCISDDGKTFIFSSDISGGYGGKDLWKLQYSEGEWSSPVNLGPQINTTRDELFPSIYNDSILYFSSDGFNGYGGLDILEIPLDSLDALEPNAMAPPINSYADDFALLILNPDRGLFSSNRKGGMGRDDIYSFVKTDSAGPDKEPPILNLIVRGTVSDYQSGEALSNSLVTLKLTYGHVDTLVCDSKGKFIFSELMYSKYLAMNFIVNKKGYLATHIDKFFTKDSLEIDKINAISDTLEIDIKMVKITRDEIIISNIYYDLGSWTIREESKASLNRLFGILTANPDLLIEIDSHTDSRGSADFNMELSQKRAEAVVQNLINRGIDYSRVIAVGFGETMPLVQAANVEKEHEMNRRTSFRIRNYQQIKDRNEAQSLSGKVKN